MAEARKHELPIDYGPTRYPILLRKLEGKRMEKIMDTVVVEGVEFTILEKPKTLYAGFHIVAPDVESEPDVMDTFRRFQEGHTRIVDATTPECMICLSIGYREWNLNPVKKREFMHCKETSNPVQPEGITVLEAPPCTMIRVKASDEAWTLTKKLTGQDNPMWHMAPLFHLAQAIFCTPERGFAAGSKGNHETEYYHFDGSQYVAIPVTALR